MTDKEIMTNEEAVVILENAIKKPNTRDGYLGQALTMAIKALESQRWIPVSEPPKEDGKYLVSRKNEENIWVEEAYYSTTSRTTFPKGFSIIKDNFSWRINNVIAWQNLPQPYKEEIK